MKKPSLILNIIFTLIIIAGGISMYFQHQKINVLTREVKLQTMKNFAHQVELIECQEKLHSLQRITH